MEVTVDRKHPAFVIAQRIVAKVLSITTVKAGSYIEADLVEEGQGLKPGTHHGGLLEVKESRVESPESRVQSQKSKLKS